MRRLFYLVFLSLALICLTNQNSFAQSSQTLVFAHFAETQGSISSSNSFDSVLRMVSYRPITLDIYIFDDQTGLPLRSAAGFEVCNPCSYSFASGSRKKTLDIGSLLIAAGGFPRPVVTGQINAYVRGGIFSDFLAVLQIVNSKTGAFDLSYEYDYGKVLPTF
ncbi:MAG: hypothetical protein AB1489_32415 [Acidobacteriota bacterium]